MKNWNRTIPYISIGFVTAIVFILSRVPSINKETREILIGIFSNSVFFFLVYLFYDSIKQVIIKKENRYLVNYIKYKISNDIFVALYFLKKTLHGYNLDANTLGNILNIVDYSENEILSALKSQNYLGFQIFKNLDEVRSLFRNVVNDNLVLKYSTHIDSINILRITNNLAFLESLLKNEHNFSEHAEKGTEFIIMDGKQINPDNDEGYLLLKKTSHSQEFVVYDSGYFEQDKIDILLNRYVLKEEPAKRIASLLSETFGLMKYWLPSTMHLSKNESRFRIIKDFLSFNTNARTKKSKIYVADIIKVE